MINSKTDYLDYLNADRKALGIKKTTYINLFKGIFYPDYIWNFQRILRKTEYYKNCKRKGVFNTVYCAVLYYRFKRISVKLGFTIPTNVFGPGLAIVHYGSIIVSHHAKIGANCRINACTNIGASGGSIKAPVIGNNVYIAPGVKIFGDIVVPDNTAIGANSVVNKSFHQKNTLIAGVPAKVIKQIDIKKIIKHI